MKKVINDDARIWFFKPYAEDKNLGKAYNDYCQLAAEDDWICLMDGDAMFLVSNYGHIIRDYINRYPSASLLLPVTNRVGKGSHCYQGKRSEDPDMRNHRKIAKMLSDSREVKNMNHVRWPSMPCFVFSKKLWKQVGGFDETGRILGVDVRFSKKAMDKGDCYRMNGLYLLHYYRLNEGIHDKSHVL